MPPRRRSERTKANPEEDVDPTEQTSTPTRKRRRLNGAEAVAVRPSPSTAPLSQPTQTARADTPDSVATRDGEEEEEELSKDECIQNLKVARYTATATIELSNDLQKTAQQFSAFAKISGRDWSYMVRNMVNGQLMVYIGRGDHAAPEPETLTAGAPPEPQMVTVNGARMPIHIDLGPNKEVSRVHAELKWNGDDEIWILSVNGRNGLKVDGTQHARGEQIPMRSGMIISILGTEMMWEEPTKEAVIADMYKYPSRAHGRSPSTDEDTRKRRRNHKGFSEDRQFSEHDIFPPSTTKRNKQVEHNRRPPSSANHNSSFINAAFGNPAMPDTPSGSRKDKFRVSPAYPRGVMLESTEDIDYSLDSSKDLKPPHSYAQLIGYAILSSPEEQLTLSNIYAHIAENYAYFRHGGTGWQNSIRHNLSLSKSFEKVARRTDEPGKGMKWKIVESERENFLKKILGPSRKGATVHRGSSGPSSPAAGLGPLTGERLMDITGRNHLQSPTSRPIPGAGSVTPPRSKYTGPNEAYTPERGPRLGNIPNMTNGITTQTPLNPRRPKAEGQGASANDEGNVRDSSGDPAGASAGLQSPVAPYTDAKHFGANLVTPLVARQAVALGPPSTQQVPSFFANLSSPAPFFKLSFDTATPYGKHDLYSPLKRERRNSDDEEKEEPAQPSSPPIVRDTEEAEDEVEADAREKSKTEVPSSPTRSVSRPQSRRNTFSQSGRERATSTGSSLPNGVADTTAARAPMAAIHYSLGSQGKGTKRPASAAPPSSSAPAGMRAPVGLGMSFGGNARGEKRDAGMMAADDSEEEIDLTKGFQKIGTFHQSLAGSFPQGYGGPVRAP